ncbi:MAG: LPS export ABC transporter periplasmic protein LptC [Alistipes sp.]|nr:LPS export ABC transporter periplasmic protein LptC [Alistipes sp.]
MFASLKKYASVALLLTGSAILLYSCKGSETAEEEPLETIKTEESENLSIVVSENGRKSYRFKTPLLEGYTLGRDPYREFRKGIDIITYQDDSMTTVNATLVANYAIYYENRKLWEAKGNVVVTKADGTRLYTQQLFWNSITKRIYSNVDTKVVTDTDTFIGEGFESDEELKDLHFRRFKSKMRVDTAMQTEGRDSTKVEPQPAAADGNDVQRSGLPERPARTPVRRDERGGESSAPSRERRTDRMRIDRKPTEPFGGTQPNKTDGSAEPAEKTVVPAEMKRMTNAMETRMVEAAEE